MFETTYMFNCTKTFRQLKVNKDKIKSCKHLNKKASQVTTSSQIKTVRLQVLLLRSTAISISKVETICYLTKIHPSRKSMC